MGPAIEDLVTTVLRPILPPRNQHVPSRRSAFHRLSSPPTTCPCIVPPSTTSRHLPLVISPPGTSHRVVSSPCPTCHPVALQTRLPLNRNLPGCSAGPSRTQQDPDACDRRTIGSRSAHDLARDFTATCVRCHNTPLSRSTISSLSRPASAARSRSNLALVR